VQFGFVRSPILAVTQTEWLQNTGRKTTAAPTLESVIKELEQLESVLVSFAPTCLLCGFLLWVTKLNTEKRKGSLLGRSHLGRRPHWRGRVARGHTNKPQDSIIQD
jgi:hypothetical protein